MLQSTVKELRCPTKALLSPKPFATTLEGSENWGTPPGGAEVEEGAAVVALGGGTETPPPIPESTNTEELSRREWVLTRRGPVTLALKGLPAM